MLGVLGTEEDLLQIYGLYRKTPDLERLEVWEGAMERLYWKFRIPPLQELELKNLKLTKIRKVKIGDGEVDVINADGTGETQLTNERENDRGHMSPDGSKIVFESTQAVRRTTQMRHHVD